MSNTLEKARAATQINRAKTVKLRAQLYAHLGKREAQREIGTLIHDNCEIHVDFQRLTSEHQEQIAIAQLVKIYHLDRQKPLAKAMPSAPRALSGEAIQAMLLARLHHRGYLVVRVAPQTFIALISRRGVASARLITIQPQGVQLNHEQVRFVGNARNAGGFKVEVLRDRAELDALKL